MVSYLASSTPIWHLGCLQLDNTQGSCSWKTRFHWLVIFQRSGHSDDAGVDLGYMAAAALVVVESARERSSGFYLDFLGYGAIVHLA